MTWHGRAGRATISIQEQERLCDPSFDQSESQKIIVN